MTASVAIGRLCTRCQVRQPVSSFSAGQWMCRPCNTDYMRAYRARDPLYAFRANLRQKYKMTIEDYEGMLAAQGGHCALCSATAGKQRLHVDHDHRCCPGKVTCGRCVRGIVCFPCNTKLSILEGDTDYSRRMYAYLGLS